MADETSSIALQLNVQLRGLVNLTKLNAGLVELKKNARGFQQNLGKGNATLGNVGKKAKEAADGLNKLTKANKDLAKVTSTGGGRNINDHMAAVFKKVQQKTYDDAAKAAARTNDYMARQFARIQKQMSADATKSARERTRQEAQVTRMNEQAARRTEATIKRTAALRDMYRRREMAGLQREMQQRQRIDDMSKSLTGRLRIYEEQNDAIFRAGFRLQMLGNDMEALGKKAIGALAGMSREFGDFEFMVNRAAGAAGIMNDEVSAGQNVYKKFSDSILNASADLRLFKPEEVARATYYWASTTGEQIDNLGQLEALMKNINPLMKIAAMTQTDYETAIKGVYSILVQYGLGTDRVTDVVEKLHMVTQRTAAEFPDLINSFKMVGPVAKEFGVTFDDMVVLLGRLADAGIRGTMSGRAFRQFFIQISKPSKPATEALNDLWASTKQFGDKSYLDTVFPKGQFIGVNQYVDELAKRLQGATDKERMFTLASITTANELPVLTALVSKQISSLKGLGGGWDKTKENLQNASAGFRQSWEKLRTSWNGTIGALTQGVEVLRIKVGERIAKIFTPVLNKVIEKLTELRAWFMDEKNGPIVDFFVKLAGLGAGLLTLGGALTVLVGVLVAMTAASRVAFKAFSPLFGLFGKIGGTIAAFAFAVIRNFDYVKSVFEDVAKTIGDAMKHNKDAVDGFSEAVTAFGNIVNPVFDAVIRIFGELLKVGARVVAWVLQSKDAVNILGVAANILGGIIAGRLVVGMARAVLGFSGFTKALSAARAGMIGMATVVKTLDVAYGIGGGGFKGLANSIKMLIPTLGKGGLLAAGLAAVAGLFLVAYANSTKFKTSVDRFIFETITSLGELKQAVSDVRAELGEFGPDAQAALNLDPQYKAMQESIDRMREMTSGYASDWVIMPDERANLRQLEILEKDFAAYERDTYNTYKDWVSELNALGSNVTLDQYMSRLRMEANRLNKTITDDQVRRNANQYFLGMARDIKNADAEAVKLVDSFEKVRTSTTATPEQKSMELSKLINLQGSGLLTSEAARTVQQSIDSGMAAGIEAAGQDPAIDEAAKSTVGEISQSLLKAARDFMDLDKNLGQVMKDAIRPGRQIASVFKSYMKGWISKGFKDSDGHFHVEAALFAQQSMDDLRTQFQTYLSVLPAADSKDFVNNTIKQFKTDFKNGLPKSVTPEMADQLFLFIQDVYRAAGKPIPESYVKMFTDRGSSVAAAYVAGIAKPENKTNATTAARSIYEGAEEGLKPDSTPTTYGSNTTHGFYTGFKKWTGPIKTAANNAASSMNVMNKADKSYDWGYDLGKNLAKGLRDTFKIVNGAAVYLGRAIYGPLHQSVADYGPLRDTDQWGFHLGQNIATGMDRSVRTVRESALNVARAAAMANTFAQDNLVAGGGINLESSADRTIKVQVEVTSPDGSVDRLKAAELERGLMTSDLILSIEHMATVG